MKISLKKANVIQQQIRELLNQKLVLSVSLDEFENPTSKINKETEALKKQFANKAGLIRTLFMIRDLVGKQNQEVITGKLAILAECDKHIALCDTIVSQQPRADLDVIKNKLDKMKLSPATNPLYKQDTLTVSLITQDFINAVKEMQIEWKKVKQNTMDEISELNIVNKIELDDDAVEFLKSNGLL